MATPCLLPAEEGGRGAKGEEAELEGEGRSLGVSFLPSWAGGPELSHSRFTLLAKSARTRSQERPAFPEPHGGHGCSFSFHPHDNPQQNAHFMDEETETQKM